MKTIKSCLLFLLAATTTAFIPAFAETVKDAKWGNVGNATDGGVATKADSGNYSNVWTLDFGDTNGVCTMGIGADGVVQIRQIRMAKRKAPNDATQTPSIVYLEQDDEKVASTNLEIVTGGISAYAQDGSVVTDGTRDAYVFTFGVDATFDTSKSIVLSFDVNNAGLGMMQPANPTFQYKSYSPIIEITGDYSPNGSMKQELQHHYSFDGTAEATSGQPLTFEKGSAVDSYVDSGHGQAYKISDSACPYGTGILQCGEECWTIATFAKLVKTDNAVVWASGRHSDNTGYVALTTGTGGRVQVVKSMSSTAMAAQTLITSSIMVDDCAEKYHLFTVTRNNNFLKLYVDGNLVGTYQGSVQLPDARFQLGRVRGSLDNTDLVAGNDICIDEWRLYQGELSADEVKDLAEKFPVWPRGATMPESVSINFIGGSSNKTYPNGMMIADTNVAGVVEIAGAQWNQIIDKGGVVISTNGIPLKEVLKDGSTLTGVMTADVQAKCTWNALGNSTPMSGNGQMMYGYLDDGETSGGYGARVTVNDIPYSEYTVYVYMGADDEMSYSYAKQFRMVYVNDVGYPATIAYYGWWGYASATHENGSPLTLTEQNNYLKISGVTGSVLRIVGSTASYYDRCGIAGIQIVNTGTRAATGGDYVANITAAHATWGNGTGPGLEKLSSGAWENDNTAAITLTNLTDNATLTFDTVVTAATVRVVQAAGKSLTLKATVDTEVGKYDFSKNAGTVSVGTDLLGNACALAGNNAKIIPGGTVDFALGENGTMSASGDGSANNASVKYTLSSGTLTIGASGGNGPFNKSPLTVNGTTSFLKLTGLDATGYNLMTNPAFTFEDGATLQIGVRDSLTTPIVLKDSSVVLMNGCANSGRGLDLFNSNGNDWTVEGDSDFALDPMIGEAGKRVYLRRGDWNVEVKTGGRFDVDVVLYGANKVNKTGAGDMYLNGVNEYTGGTVIGAGKVYAGNAKALGTGTVKIEEGGTLVFYLDDFATITGAVKPFDFADAASQARVEAIPSISHPEITYDPTTGKVKIDTSKSGVTGLHVSSINPKPKGFDPNGHESSVVYLTNYGPDPVNLKDYKLVRTNFGKKVKPTDADILPLLEYEIAAGDTYAVYLSEDYETASDFGGDGKTVKWFGSVMVVPTKINPKKYPMVRLYDAAGSAVIDEVIVPCDLDDDITVEIGLNTNKLVRYVVNGTTRTEIGPDANGPYGVKDLKNDIELMNGRSGFVSTTNGFTVILPVNPLKTGDTVLEPNKIKSVTLEYRFFDKDKMSSAFAEMAKLKKGDAGYDKNYGDQWAATISQAELEGKEGKLLQYRAIITDNGDATWTAPRFCHPELGYEWYGAVVEPSEATRTENLPTMLMFADSVNLVQMDKDVDNQDKSQVPYNARIAIYDTSTHRYYDNVRIDLRGNTSANFYKKSHGLRFSKVAPFTTTNPLDGKKWEVRKSSFCTEYADPTYIRQSLSFWLLNQVGSPAPFHYPVRLYLNGEFYQLAFHTERFTDELIEDVYGLNKFVYSYKNIGTFGGSTSAGGIEKKTPDDDNEKDLTVLNAYMNRYKTAASKVVTSMTEAEKAALTKNVVTNFDLSAWLNYIAISKITHENDDVWANLSGYINKYDALHNPDGNDLMAPLAYDMNLSWGQWYYGDDSSAGRCGVRPADDNFKSHPFYGGMTIRAHKGNGGEIGNGNRAYEAVWQNEKFRRLYLRRLRTLMDAWLKEPGTPKEETPLWTQYVEPFKALIEGDDVTDDRTKWDYAHIANRASAIWVWSTALSLEDGYDDLWNNYVEPRRLHLYGKHAETNAAMTTGYATGCKAGIPAKQSAVADLKAKIGYELVDGGVKITNGNEEEIDISGWTIAGPVVVTIPAGTVLDSVQGGIPGEVYFVTNRIAWCEANAAVIVDQFVVGNVASGASGSDVTLKTATGEDVIAPKEESEQEKYLRLWGFCGVPDGTPDANEFIIFTNLNQNAELDITDADIRFEKTGESKGRCNFKLSGTIAAGGWVRFDQAKVPWEKITNGIIDIRLLSSDGAGIYSTNGLNQTDIGVDGTGYFAVYDFSNDTWGKMLIKDAPGGDTPTPPPGPGGGVISGDFPDGLVTNVTAGTVLKIGNATFGKALTISGADATIELQAGTVATAPAITASGALTFDGDGTLVVSNDVTLITATGLVVSNGVLKLDFRNGEAKASAVYLKGDFKQFGGAVSLNLASDNTVYGIQIDKKDKEAYFEGGTFSAVVNAGEKSAAIKLEKGSSHANLKGGTTTVTMGGPTNRFVNTEGKIKISGGYAATVTSSGIDARVFKSVKEITIAGDTVVKVTASGDGSEAFSTDDSIKMSGGVVAATAADDCFSAQTNIVISAGKVQAMSTAGDAIDSNGDVTISGGYVLANTLAEGELGIEADGKFVVSGGSVVAVGYENMIHLPDAGSVACYTNESVKYDKKYVEVAGTNDAHKTILTVNLNKKCAKKFSLVATCPGFVGTVSYTDTKPDKDKSYIDKLDENIDGAFLTTLDIVKPGETPKMEAKTEEEAQEEIKKYEVQLTEEDKRAGVPKDALKMEAIAITNGTGEVTGYKAVVGLNPEVVDEPSVGGDQPIEITPGEGGTEVSVGINNATKGLWYGYEVCNALGDGFANDVPSFNRATDTSVTITGSKRSGNAAFFRVKVLPAKPTK